MTNTGDKLDFMQISIRLARWQQNFSFCLPYIRIFLVEPVRGCFHYINKTRKKSSWKLLAPSWPHLNLRSPLKSLQKQITNIRILIVGNIKFEQFCFFFYFFEWFLRWLSIFHFSWRIYRRLKLNLPLPKRGKKWDNGSAHLLSLFMCVCV